MSDNKKHSWSPLFLLLAFAAFSTVILPGYSEAKERKIAFVVGTSGRLSRYSNEDIHNILETPEIEYVLFQQIITKKGVDLASRKYADMLAKAGKKLAMEIWWGPAGDFPWSKYSFANIALDKAIREDFFKEVIVPTIEGIGAENIYGVHLMEEVGMQFGTDVQKRLNPDDLDDFDHFVDNNNSYDHPFWSGYGKWPGGTNIPNVRRHENDFRSLTGLAGFNDPNTPQEIRGFLFGRWVSNRLQSLADVEFARYIHTRYPGMKVFTFSIPYYAPGNARTDFALLNRHVDGFIVDPYSSPDLNFKYYRFARSLAPDKEIICFAWGGSGTNAVKVSREDKIAKFTTAYLGGVDVFGLWTEVPGHGVRGGKIWDDYRYLARAATRLPVFEKKSKVLLIDGRNQDIYGSQFALTGLKYYDVCPLWEAHAFMDKLSEYEVVILYNCSFSGGSSLICWDTKATKAKYGFEGLLDYEKFDSFVKNGGILFLIGTIGVKEDAPLFISRQGYLHTGNDHRIDNIPNFKIEPEGWWKDTLGLNRSYAFAVRRLAVSVDNPAKVQSGNAGYFFEHGRGCVYFAPFNRVYNSQENIGSEAWKDYRQFLTDVMRQVMVLRGKEKIAEEYLALPGTGNNYLQARHDRRKIMGAVQYKEQYGHLTIMPLPGKCVFSGEKNPRMDERNQGVLVNLNLFHVLWEKWRLIRRQLRPE